ncbi:MAG: endonuclease III domain-containing protein [Planctomycetota bacterium]
MSRPEEAYRRLLDAFDPQGWWPSKSLAADAAPWDENPVDPDAWEVVVGAVLVQHTSWRNVVRAVRALDEAGAMSVAAIDAMDAEVLAELIRVAGPKRVKARRLKAVARFFAENADGDVGQWLEGVADRSVALARRRELLAVHGVGPETADVILLYAGGAPVFVVDAYKRRVMRRHGWGNADAAYDDVARWWRRGLAVDAAVYNEAHALLVRVGVEHCHARAPKCDGCPLAPMLPRGGVCG